MIQRMATREDPHVADEAIASVEQQFSTLFGRARSMLKDRAARVNPGLPALAYSLLATLVRNGGMRAGELADLVGVDKSIISRQANLLEELGLVYREPDTGDGRAIRLTATPAAIERMSEQRLREQAVLYENLRDWDIRDLEKLAELLERLNTLS
jgi:DNA-binding MarR family transcriptional regulator